MDALNYRTADPQLMINKLPVEQLTIVGVLAEQASKIARKLNVNLSGLVPRDLPGAVGLTLDGRRGEQQVSCFEDDRAWGLEIAKVVRVKLSRLGCNLVQPLVTVRNGRGKKVGEHDMVMEIVSDGGWRLYLSVELRVRRLWSQAGRTLVRFEHRKECCDELEWWQREKEHYCGRLVCLACFTTKEGFSDFELYGDLRMNAESSWRGLFGWPGSVERFVTPRPKPTSTPQLAPQPKAQAKAKANAVVAVCC